MGLIPDEIVAEATDEQILAILRGSVEPISFSIIEKVLGSPWFSHLYIRKRIWALINKGMVELTGDSLVKVKG